MLYKAMVALQLALSVQLLAEFMIHEVRCDGNIKDM